MSTVQVSGWRVESQFRLPPSLIGSRLQREGIQKALAGVTIQEAREDYWGQLELKTPACIVGYHNHKWHYAPVEGQEIPDVPVQTSDRRVARILDRYPQAKWMLRPDADYELSYVKSDVPQVVLVQDGHRYTLQDSPMARWQSDDFVIPATATPDIKTRLIETLTPWQH